MATKATTPIREDHVRLLQHVEHIRFAAQEVPELSPEERKLLVARVLEFLEGTLVPHMDAEEHVLYPEVARILGNEKGTAPMSYDHLAIHSRIEELAVADLGDTARLQQLLYGLQALISVHFWKEEALYLPLVDEQGSPEVRAALEAARALVHGRGTSEE